MSATQCTEQLELFEVGRQKVTMTFNGGNIVSDAGLLPIRELDQKLGILAEAARRMPDPRTEKIVRSRNPGQPLIVQSEDVEYVPWTCWIISHRYTRLGESFGSCLALAGIAHQRSEGTSLDAQVWATDAPNTPTLRSHRPPQATMHGYVRSMIPKRL